MPMNIKDLRDGMRTVEVQGEITEIGKEKEVSLRTGGTGKTAKATLKDQTGSISLPLWDADIEKVVKGDVVKISNGYINSYQGEVQLNVGRYGKLSVVGRGYGPPEEQKFLSLTSAQLTEERVKQIIYDELKALGVI